MEHILFLPGASGYIIAIEPQPRLTALIENSLSLTSCCKYKIYQFACSDHEGSTEFYIPNHNSGEAGIYSSFSASNEHRSITVTLKRFDNAVDSKKLPGEILLKMDIEGSEYAFLKGAKEFFKARQPVVMMEVNAKSLKSAGVSKEELLSMFNGLGYASYHELDNPYTTFPLVECDMALHRVIVILPTKIKY